MAAERKVKFRCMLRKLADTMTVEDRCSIAYLAGIGIEGLDSLEVLMKLEKEGHFTQNDVSGLQKLLLDLNRRDLVALVREYREVETGADKGDMESCHHVLHERRQHMITVGDLEVHIDVTPGEDGSHDSYTCKIRSGRKMRPFSMELRIGLHENGLECVIPEEIAEGSNDTKIYIGDQDVIATIQQQDVNLMKLSGMVDGLETLVYKQRERVEKQGALIAQQGATISDLENKYSSMQLLVFLLLSPVYNKIQLL